MRMCPEHWGELRAAIEERGLSALVAESGERAMGNMASELEHGRSIDNFDPLMLAHNAIVANAMELAKERYMADPLAMMVEDPAHPEWQCPICYLNWLHAEHDEHCTKPGCDYPRGYRWDDYFIRHAAEGAAKAWEELRP